MSTNFAQTQFFTLYGAGASIGDTSITLTTFNGIDGTPLVMADFGTKGFLTLEPGSSTQEEQVSFTGRTANANGTITLTGIKTVLFISPYTETSGLAKSHAGSTRVVVSNTSGFYARLAAKDNAESITGVWTFDATTGRPKLSSDVDTAVLTEFPTFGQLSRVVVAGAPDASTTTKGIVEIATQAEVDAGDDSGTTTAPVVIVPSAGANAVQRGVWLKFTETASGDDAYTASTSPVVVEEEGTIVNGTLATPNTAACTFALNAGSPAAIKVYTSGALADPETGDIVAGQPVVLRKTGSNWVMLNPKATWPTTAIMTEMSNFFSTTTATGAQVQSLVDGSTVTIHGHPTSSGTTTKNAADASTTQVIAHGLAVAPRWVRIDAFIMERSSSHDYFATTFYNGTTQSSVSYSVTDLGPTSTLTTTFRINTATAASVGVVGTVTVDATNISIAWVKTGSATGVYTLLWSAGA